MNRFLFLLCSWFFDYDTPCSFQHDILGNPVFFVPMTIIRIEIKFGRGVAHGGVVSVEAVASHCRGKRGKEREEGGQVSAVALRYERCTHMHVFPRLNLNLRILQCPITRVHDKLGQAFFSKEVTLKLRPVC